MNNKRATKRALLTSVMALVMCVVMLVGTTFAWFTDTASTGVNKIQAGNLDVDLEMYDTAQSKWVSAEGKTLNFLQKQGDEAGKVPSADILWEPGCTYELPELRIVNKGNLALKYKISISGAKDATPENDKNDLKLLDVIDWTYNVSGDGGATVAALGTERHLAAKTGEADVFDTLTIKGQMQKSAGNDYQGMAIEGIAITVVATQDTVENDSFDDQYDKDATYPVASAAEMKEALANGGIVSVNKDIKTDNIDDNEADRITISEPTTLNLDAKIVSPDNMGNNNTNFCALIVDADTTINAGENGGIDTGRNGGYALNVRKGANLTITGGSYYGGGTAVQVQEGTLTITGGHFAVEPFSDARYGYEFMLNCIDAAYKNGTAKIIVKGGTFVNFNPANCKAEGAGTNFVADGYKVVSATQTNGDVWYTVVSK